MNPVQELLNLDWQVTLLGIFTIVGSGIALVTLWKQFCQIFGIKFAFLENRKAELVEIAELKNAMEKMNENCEKHTKAMMAFVTCVKTVIKNALETISINAPEKM